MFVRDAVVHAQAPPTVDLVTYHCVCRPPPKFDGDIPTQLYGGPRTEKAELAYQLVQEGKRGDERNNKGDLLVLEPGVERQ